MIKRFLSLIILLSVFQGAAYAGNHGSNANEWFKSVKSVYAFEIKQDGGGMDYNSLLSKDGEISKFVSPKEGIMLTESQKETLVSSLSKQDLSLVSMCVFTPRHGFVLYDDQNAVLGVLEICFECNDFNTSIADVFNRVDFTKLNGLFTELGIPPKLN